MTAISPDETILLLKLTEEAIGEFQRDGKVTTLRCHCCGDLLEVVSTPLGSWQARCICGRFPAS